MGPTGAAVVVLAAGCFWSVELVYQRLPGVIKTRVGYVDGMDSDDGKAVTYDVVQTGKTGHAEAVEVTYAPDVVSHEDIFDVFFQIHDPTTRNKQGNDEGVQYRSGVWVTNADQHMAYNMQREMHMVDHRDPILTELSDLEVTMFVPAEEEHQRYLEKAGQSAAKGDVSPIVCYGNRGPEKVLNKPGLRELFRRDVEGKTDL